MEIVIKLYTNYNIKATFWESADIGSLRVFERGQHAIVLNLLLIMFCEGLFFISSKFILKNVISIVTDVAWFFYLIFN